MLNTKIYKKTFIRHIPYCDGITSGSRSSSTRSSEDFDLISVCCQRGFSIPPYKIPKNNKNINKIFNNRINKKFYGIINKEIC